MNVDLILKNVARHISLDPDEIRVFVRFAAFFVQHAEYIKSLIRKYPGMAYDPKEYRCHSYRIFT